MLQELYLYYNYNSRGSFLSYSEVISIDLKLIKIIYVISPNIKIIPPGTELFCARQTENTIIDFQQITDPYEKEEDCLYFISWGFYAPNTVPLYITRENVITLTFEKTDEKKQLYFSPIHVLLEKTHFAFYNKMCVPDSSGFSLEECINKSLYPSEKSKHQLNKMLNDNSFSTLKLFDSKKRNNNSKKIIIVIFFIIIFFIILYLLIKLKNLNLS